MHTLNGRTTGSEIVLARVFHVPRSLVFRAWTDPRQVASWWGPYGFTSPVCRWEARVNGNIYIEMTASDGAVFPMKGIFHEIVAPGRLVFTSCAFEDEEGRIHLEVLNTVTLTEENGATFFTLQASVKKASPEVRASLDGMQEGWDQGLDKLEKLLYQHNMLS